MHGAHYAISEALIVLVALWGAARLWRGGYSLAAVGILLFGTAAAIGTYRFGTDQVESFAAIHKSFSQSGGAIAMALISGQLLLSNAFVRQQPAAKRVILALIAASALAALLAPDLTTLLFLGWLIIAIVTACLIPAPTVARRLGFAAIVSIFLVNLLLVRQSAALGPSLSWHLFHTLVAIWIVGMVWIFGRNREAQK